MEKSLKTLVLLATTLSLQAQWSTNVIPSPVVGPFDIISLRNGRQLFVDDYLIESSNLKRKWYQAIEWTNNPVLAQNSMSMPFSDGIWWYPLSNHFRMYYLAQGQKYTGLAISTNGYVWIRPDWGISTNYTNAVMVHTNLVQIAPDVWRDSSSFIYDPQDTNFPWKAAIVSYQATNDLDWCWWLTKSTNGINWETPIRADGEILDRSTVFWNPITLKWTWIIKGSSTSWPYRAKRIWETSTFDSTNRWILNSEPAEWLSTDALDPKRIDNTNLVSELYNVDICAYESLLIGFNAIWQGDPGASGKYNSVQLSFSRDGRTFYKPNHSIFYGYSNDPLKWNYRNVQSSGPGLNVLSDTLLFYANGQYSQGRHCGLYTLRRDGFCSLGTNGYLVTRPFIVTKPYLFVNANIRNSLQVSLLSVDGDTLLNRQQTYITGNSTAAIVLWGTNRLSLSNYLGLTVKLKFMLQDTDLYSFWLSDFFNGETEGWKGGGGPPLAEITLNPTGSTLSKTWSYLTIATLPGYVYDFYKETNFFYTIPGNGQSHTVYYPGTNVLGVAIK